MRGRGAARLVLSWQLAFSASVSAIQAATVTGFAAVVYAGCGGVRVR
jgi:hypothetical protein